MADLPAARQDPWYDTFLAWLFVAHNADGTAKAHTHTVPWQLLAAYPAPSASGETSPDIYIHTATTLTAFRAKRPDGTGAVLDLLKNGVSVLSAQLSLTTTNWTAAAIAGGQVALAPGDVLKPVLVSAAGGVTMVSASIEGTRQV